MRILLSNDDGIESPGLIALAEVLEKLGDLVVVAPDREQSGTSHSLTLLRPLRIQEIKTNWFSIDGTPSDCVNLAIREILKDRLPDLVVSGVNRGPNLGDDILYSGTAAAAMEGAIQGIPGMAFSLVLKRGESPNYSSAQAFAKRMVKRFQEHPWPSEVVMNVNVPNQTGDPITSYAFTRQGKRHYTDVIVKNIDPRGRPYFWIGGDAQGFDEVPGSDGEAVHRNLISITPIRLNLTHETYLQHMTEEWHL